MAKTRINVSLDPDLAEFAGLFAAENRTSLGGPLKGNWQGFYSCAVKRSFISGPPLPAKLAWPNPGRVHGAFQQGK